MFGQSGNREQREHTSGSASIDTYEMMEDSQSCLRDPWASQSHPGEAGVNVQHISPLQIEDRQKPLVVLPKAGCDHSR